MHYQLHCISPGKILTALEAFASDLHIKCSTTAEGMLITILALCSVLHVFWRLSLKYHLVTCKGPFVRVLCNQKKLASMSGKGICGKFSLKGHTVMGPLVTVGSVSVQVTRL